RGAHRSDRGNSESDRVSLAPYGHVSALQVHSTEGLPALWPSRLRKDLDRTSGCCQSLKAGGRVRPGRARYGYEGGQAAGDSRGLCPRQAARDAVYVAGVSRGDGPGTPRRGPGRIDRQIRVCRPNRDSSAAIVNVYLTDDLPLDRQWIDQHGGDRKKACADLIEHVLSAIFSRIDENRLLSIRLRSGQNKVL